MESRQTDTTCRTSLLERQTQATGSRKQTWEQAQGNKRGKTLGSRVTRNLVKLKKENTK